MAQLGRALRSGRRGRGFESRHADDNIGTMKDRQGFGSVYFWNGGFVWAAGLITDNCLVSYGLLWYSNPKDG